MTWIGNLSDVEHGTYVGSRIREKEFQSVYWNDGKEEMISWMPSINILAYVYWREKGIISATRHDCPVLLMDMASVAFFPFSFTLIVSITRVKHFHYRKMRKCSE